MSLITIYKHFNPDSIKAFKHIDVILGRIRDGKSYKQVNICRDAYADPKAYAKAKKQLPAILFSGQFEHRSITGLIQHSGYICLDFDKFQNEDELQFWRDNLEGDNYTYSIFISPSGMGLKCLVKIPTYASDVYTNHKASFRSLQAYYNCPYFDTTVFDVCRICFESYDPELQINPDSQVWMGQTFDPPPVKVEYGQASLSEQETARRLLKWSEKRFPIVAGQRNQNLFRLCASMNDFGINYDYAFSLVAQFQSDDFRLPEIETTLKSAYKKSSSHGKLSF